VGEQVGDFWDSIGNVNRINTQLKRRKKKMTASIIKKKKINKRRKQGAFPFPSGTNTLHFFLDLSPFFLSALQFSMLIFHHDII
jgi:hypothetical protein